MRPLESGISIFRKAIVRPKMLALSFSTNPDSALTTCFGIRVSDTVNSDDEWIATRIVRRFEEYSENAFEKTSRKVMS